MIKGMQTAKTPQFELRHRLSRALEWSGLDPLDMAEFLGVHRNTISNYTTGKTQPRRSVLRDWARLTKVPFTWLESGMMIEDDDDPDTEVLTRGQLRPTPYDVPLWLDEMQAA